MAEDIFLVGKFTDFTDQRQLYQLNEIISQMLARLNQIDPGSVALSFLQGTVAGKVIASEGAGNSPAWEASPLLTGATFSGLTASQLVATDGSKALVSYGSLPTLAASTYTPTAGNTVNLDATPTTYLSQYLRLSTVVTVSGRFTADPTAAIATSFTLTLPVASAFGATQDCAGVAFSPGIAGQGAAILADTVNAVAKVSWKAVDLTNQDWYYLFTYRIL